MAPERPLAGTLQSQGDPWAEERSMESKGDAMAVRTVIRRAEEAARGGSRGAWRGDKAPGHGLGLRAPFQEAAREQTGWVGGGNVEELWTRPR